MPQVVTFGNKSEQKGSDWEIAKTLKIVDFQHDSGISYKVKP